MSRHRLPFLSSLRRLGEHPMLMSSPARSGCCARPAGRCASKGLRRGLLLLVLLAGAAVAAAQSAEAATQILALVPSFEALLTNIRNWIMGILALAATVFLTIGGVRYLLANGDPGEVEKAKGSFRNAAFGFLLAAAAPLVVNVLRGLVGV